MGVGLLLKGAQLPYGNKIFLNFEAQVLEEKILHVVKDSSSRIGVW